MLSSNKHLILLNRSLWATVFVFIIFSITFIFYIRSEKAIDAANTQRFESHRLADRLRQSSDDLTRMVRTYILTDDPLYKQHYQEILDIRNGTISRPNYHRKIYWDLVLSDDKRPFPSNIKPVSLLNLMKEEGYTPQEFAKLSEAKKNSDELTKIEFEAMKIIESTTPTTDKNRYIAYTMLHDAKYHQAKYRIMKPISDAYIMMDQRTHEAVDRAVKMAYLMRIIFILFGVILIWAVWRIRRTLHLIIGGSLQYLHSHIVKIGSGDLSSEIQIDEGLENSILGWLSETKNKLSYIDTERKKNESQLSMVTQAMEQSPSSIIITDFKGNIEYVNSAFITATGYTSDEVIGKNPRLLQSGSTPAHAYDSMWDALVRQEKWQGEFINKRKDGTNYIYSINIAPVLDKEGKTTHYIAIEEDISEQKKTQEKIHYLANFDPLTALPNRMQMDDHLQYTLNLAKRNEGSFALIFLDLDHFKSINDTLGHSIGDLLLMELSKRLSAAVREEDTVSRMGGDEFILLLPETDANGAAQVAQKLLSSIANPFKLANHELTVTASIGIALYPSDGTDIETLSKNADVAMYRAKQEGRNAYCFFTHEMQRNSQRNLELSNALHTALERNEFHLVYQPQLSAADGKIIGSEALIRWEHPQFGSVSPAEFIPIAEDTGIILSLGEWVLRTAVSQAAAWRQKGITLIMAVNLSAVQFRHPSLPSLIVNILDEAKLDPQYLEIELTEGVAMHDPKDAIKVMNTLNEIGIRMSIDDFGTGYSSLSYLKQFKVYKLKIDQSFVRDIRTDPEDKAIVKAVIQLAHSLELVTIAEGVETLEQLQFLQEQGCDEIQGYYYTKPILANIFEKFYASHQITNNTKE
ncbi:MAG: EAL domain-containing protein [Sulfuricurvum sp.]|nr:EAL domain-containing protein [Sulfuricurvum sp.]MDP3023484.1 EAL domain-containing protein [Sulfuricurvum sp.]